jgi:hypothetical protein
MNQVAEMRVTVRQFLTKPSTDPRYKDKQPVPFRVMFGYITQETKSSVFVHLRAKPEPSSHCLRCGREITNPTSLLYGFGIECITKVPFATPLVDPNKLDEYMKDLQSKMADIVWEGWLPKAYIDIIATGEMIDPFGAPTTVIQPQSSQPVAPVQPTIQRTPIKDETPVVDQHLVSALIAELGF